MDDIERAKLEAELAATVAGVRSGAAGLTPAEKQPSMSGIQALIDQVNAGVEDACDAWHLVKMMPLPKNEGLSAPISADRFARAEDDLREAARRLRELAEDIRSRQ
jgi:hypothetical protein